MNSSNKTLNNEKIEKKFDLTSKTMLIILFLVSVFISLLIGIGIGKEFVSPDSKKIEEVIKAEKEGRIEIIVVKKEVNGKLIYNDTILYRIREKEKGSL